MKRLRFLLILDTILLVTVLVLMVPDPLALHEWLGVAVIPIAVIHLLFAWQWIATALPRLSAKGAWRLRVNVLLNALLFYAFVVAMFSGVMESAIALPKLGMATMAGDQNWAQLHNKWVNIFQILAGLHLAINWNWIVGTVRRLVFKRPTARGDAAIAAVAAEAETRP